MPAAIPAYSIRVESIGPLALLARKHYQPHPRCNTCMSAGDFAANMVPPCVYGNFGEDFAIRALTGRFAGCASTGSWMLYRITREKIFRHQIQRIPTDLSRPVFGVFTRCTKKGALGIAKELRPAPRPPTTPPGGGGWDTTAGASLRPPPGARSWSPPPPGARGQFGAK